MKILITGAASGMMYEVAKVLIKKGHLLYLCTHTNNQLKALKEKLKEDSLDALCFKLNVTSEEDRKLVDKVAIDCLISHAGIGIGGSVIDTSIECLEEVYEVNIFSNFKLLQRVYNNMVIQKKKGRIFVTSSLASMIPLPYLGFYTSSKAAISLLTTTLRQEVKNARVGISISLIEPGAYHTGFNQVMIDNKGKAINYDSYLYNNEKTITRLQRNLFALIEKENTKSIVNKIVKEIERKRPKFKVRAPIMSAIVTKLYLLLYR